MEERYFLEIKRNGDIELYEENGTFYNHSNQDLLIATFYDTEQAEMICRLLNGKAKQDEKIQHYKKVIIEMKEQKGLMRFLDENDWASTEDYFACIAIEALKEEE